MVEGSCTLTPHESASKLPLTIVWAVQRSATKAPGMRHKTATPTVVGHRVISRLAVPSPSPLLAAFGCEHRNIRRAVVLLPDVEAVRARIVRPLCTIDDHEVQGVRKELEVQSGLLLLRTLLVETAAVGAGHLHGPGVRAP